MKITLPVKKNKWVATEVEVPKDTQLDVVNFSFNEGLDDGGVVCYILEGNVSDTIQIPTNPTQQQQAKINKLIQAIEEFIDFFNGKNPN
jgi:hypothetical protein